MSKQPSHSRPGWLLIAVTLGIILVAISAFVIFSKPQPSQTPTPASAQLAPTHSPPTLAPTLTAPTPIATPMPSKDDRPPRLKSLTNSWKTDWTRHTIRYDEILSGGPPRDGIPAIDAPKFISPAEAAAWLKPNEPVVALVVNDVARAYPLQIIIWHEIVNDVVTGTPVAVTFCPLCNAAVVFDRRHKGQTLEFGVSGLLRNSDLIMYDRQTESLWQQFTGEGIVGEMTGESLTWLPASIISFADFSETYPDGQVLSRDTGYNRSYGKNPYVGYDNIEQSPFLFDGIPDDRLPPMARVVTVSLGDEDVAYPYSILASDHVVIDKAAGQDLVAFYEPGIASALDARSIAEGKDVGAAGVFDPNLNDRKLTFVWQDGHFEDEQTGSQWNILGIATDGPLAGQHLTPILHADHFWFSWAAFKPDTRIYSK